MNTTNSSAGVYVGERDESVRAQGFSPSIAVLVGESNQGPVMERTLCTSVKEFIAKFGKPDAAVSFLHHSALAFFEHGTRLYVTRVAPEAKFGGLRVYRDANLSYSESWNAGLDDPTIAGFAPSDLFWVYAVDPGKWNNELQVRTFPNPNVADGTFWVEVYRQGVSRPLERHLVHLNFFTDGNGVQRHVEEYINRRSQYIRVTQNKENAEFVATPGRQLVNALSQATMVGGANARKATSGEIIFGWDLYEDPEELHVSILINGGYTDPAIQARMVEIAESRQDCFAVLDVPSLDQDTQDAITWRRTVQQLDTSYGALYTPDVLILDSYNDVELMVPPSGYAAACYARTDYEFETWFAPAGLNRGKLEVRGVRYIYNQGKRDALVDSQINPIRVIRGAGVNIWGADTLQTMPSALSNINVRRLLIYVEKALSEAALYSVFDPNDSILWSQLREMCERFLQPIKDARGLYSFNVVCDETNNLPETIAAGDLMLDIYLDPTLVAKRIHLTAVVTATSANLRVVADQGNL